MSTTVRPVAIRKRGERTLNNVTISDGSNTVPATWGTNNLSLTITDGGSNSMVLYYWPTSYSLVNTNLYGQAVPIGPVNITGFVSNFGSVAEFTPISIASVPEPSSLVLFALGAAVMAGLRRRRTR